MTVPPPQPASPAAVCAGCGAPLTGRFCSGCGAPAGSRTCTACQAALTPGARFCHRCGAAAGSAGRTGSRERTAWIVAGAAVIVSLLLTVWKVGRPGPTVPDMGNTGNVDARGSAPPGRAPDISAMSPRERFDRLYDRIMQAAEKGDSQAVMQFAPMAIGAYELLDSVNADARYHAAMIHLIVGDAPGALALADTIQSGAPGHLFADVIRGEAADRTNDTALLTRSYRSFLDHFDAELKSGRIEYTEHRPVLDDFQTRARASLPR